MKKENAKNSFTQYVKSIVAKAFNQVLFNKEIIVCASIITGGVTLFIRK